MAVTTGGQTDSMEVLNVEPILSTAVAACQTLGLFGLVVVVAVTAFVELTDWWADQ